MSNKYWIFGMAVLFLGVAMASTATMTNLLVIQNFSDFVAGEKTEAIFQFDYPGNLSDDYADAPLVAIVNITSLDENYPVTKGDFTMRMFAQKYTFLGRKLGYPITMYCSEDVPIKFKPKERNGWLYIINDVPNGVFYCYNPEYYMLDL